ncbi:MAG: C39 family peptidase [Microgenomates group bacterium]|jgi:hypothetical protein
MIRLLLGLVIVIAIANAIVQIVKPKTVIAPSDGVLVTATPTTPTTITATSLPKATPTPTPTIQVTATTSPQTTTAYKSKVLIAGVPFTPQAPFAEWSDARFQEGCEEASSLMAIYWAKNITSIDRTKAKEEIIAMVNYQIEKGGLGMDTSAQDTALKIISGYLGFNNYEVKENISLQDIKDELLKGNLIIVPANGQALNNPHFTAPGPERHMIVIRGYDDNTGTFITNDPGIRQGELYAYPQQVFYNAIRDYSTGYNAPIVGNKKIMIIIKKS